VRSHATPMIYNLQSTYLSNLVAGMIERIKEPAVRAFLTIDDKKPRDLSPPPIEHPRKMQLRIGALMTWGALKYATHLLPTFPGIAPDLSMSKV